MHDVRYDAVHDEIVVPVPYAQAILTFRGGADGQEGPIRIIQGPKTGDIGSRLDVDPVHNEIFTNTNDSILVYPREANGDVAPIRVIKGPDTRLRGAQTVIVGVQPEVAFAMVQLGLTLGDVETALDLEEGLSLLQRRTRRGTGRGGDTSRGR